MKRYIITICLASLLFSCNTGDKQEVVKITKLRRVERHPNSLEYSDRPFTKDEIRFAKQFLTRNGKNYFIDSTGLEIYLPLNQSYGESIKTYMWTLSDAVTDSVQRSQTSQ